LAKILIVDDDPAVQVTVRLLLERAGHQVIAASDGRRGSISCKAAISICCFSIFSCPAWTDLRQCG
jgi:CheY-like chemotaxis protein